MKLYIDGDDVFYPLTDFYLLFICKKWELPEMSLAQLEAKVQETIERARKDSN